MAKTHAKNDSNATHFTSSIFNIELSAIINYADFFESQNKNQRLRLSKYVIKSIHFGFFTIGILK